MKKTQDFEIKANGEHASLKFTCVNARTRRGYLNVMLDLTC